MKRARRARIVATLEAGASDAFAAALFDAGADVFRLRDGDGVAAWAASVAQVRRVESARGHPLGVMIEPADASPQVLADAAALGVDWIVLCGAGALTRARAVVGDAAWLMARVDRPMADDTLDEVVANADGVLVGPADPAWQHRVASACRKVGQPVAVAVTQADLATAIYDGVDAVLLDAAGVDDLAHADHAIARIEASPGYRRGLDASHTPAQGNTVDALCCSMRRVAALIAPAALITYTDSGSTSRRAARERPVAPILSLTPRLATARRLSLVWGVHPVLVDRLHDVGEMVKWANRTAVIEGYAGAGADVVIVAGLPFGEPGATNLLHVSRIGGTPARASAG